MRVIDANALLCYIASEISISREEREEADAKGDTLGMSHNNGEIQEARRIRRYIEKEAPTIDAESVRHGRWIRMDETFARWQCSACGAKNHSICWTYCPSCGAKMDGGTRDVE